MKRALFIFRRDLRLHDNQALNAALKAAEEIIPLFIFTPEQIENNSFKSDRCLQFMLESLEELDDELQRRGGKLYYCFGEPEKIIGLCIKELNVQGVFINYDYTPYSLKRDHVIQEVCERHSIFFHGEHDALLQPPEAALKKDGHPYTVFTPYFRHASQFAVPLPVKIREGKFYSGPFGCSQGRNLLQSILPLRKEQQKGGRKEGLHILAALRSFENYDNERDFPALSQTTRLSPHLKFNTCSVREVFHAIHEALGSEAELIRSLYWRDFFTLIAYRFPDVFEGAFRKKYNDIKWTGGKEAFQRWCDGQTGFPFVDAGMRELNATGFMHNRLRMITANFLIKDLHINWRWGEKYFAQRLIDYDPCVNNGNWQWCASTGCDAQPYFRIFNPWSQSKKFDPDCLYIKKWVPELASFSSKTIHNWHLEINTQSSYPAPMIDHAAEAAAALGYYKEIT
ncbi:MAG: DNA photolyase family protein [Parachlamydia sp.]|jgi:deoxyribodipyrimidine photo-lyase|nr:DNA photolyase family protein [Parachlamydia sp.]